LRLTASNHTAVQKATGSLLQLSVVLLLCLAQIADAATVRSAAARAEFIRENPCPPTGQRRGACARWEVDHIVPLKCSGADHKSNMQWLTVEDHRMKTKAEARWCRVKRAVNH
jgi:hypothetical protein